jgi:beta-N-acetylhexosaminidase
MGGNRVGLARPPVPALIAIAALFLTSSAAAAVVSPGAPEPPATPVPVPALAAAPPVERPTPTTDAPTSTTAPPPTTSPPPLASTSTRTTPPCPQLTSLPLRAKLAQLLFVGVAGASAARAVLDGSAPVGGVMVLGRGSTWFAGGTLPQIAAQAAVPPVVAADEEGGRIQRIDGVSGAMPSAHAMGQLPVGRVRQIAVERGRQLRELGFTMDFAPVVDLYDSGNAVINDRAFAADPEKVTRYGRAFAEGLSASGVAPVLKHFPGHGRSTGDSHRQSVAVPSLDELRASDLKPFVALHGSVPAVMVGHLDVPGLTAPGRPTSVSPEAIDGLLRGQMGFDGLVITDDLSRMKAITDRFTVADAVVASITAGADVAIVAFTTGEALDALLTRLEKAVAAGRLPRSRIDAALARLAAVKPGCR